METKERDYNGFVMNGFVALLLNLLMIAAVVLSIVGAVNGWIPEVVGGVLGDECAAILTDYFRAKR